MRILISGLCGHMGQAVASLCENGYRGAHAVYGVDLHPENATIPCVRQFAELDTLPDVPEIDCIVDFSHHTVVRDLLSYATRHRIPTVIATTGHTPEEKDEIAAAARTIPVFFAANYSFGIALLIECAKMAAKALPDAEIEIIETHHDRKLDAPSGTALAIADAICDVRPELYTHCGRNGFGKRAREEIGIHAVRIGNVVGTHEVLLSTGTQTLTLRHEAHDRRLFAEGALMAASFLADLPRETHGLYGMRNLL